MQSETIQVTFAVTAAIVGYYLYFYLFPTPAAGKGVSMRRFLASKFTGFVTMGVIPALVWFIFLNGDRYSVGFTFRSCVSYWYLLIGLPAVAAVFSAFTSKNPATIAFYPEVRLKEWTPVPLLLSCTAWFLYLLGYEFLFRGLLLFTMAAALGPVPAVAVNIALYSAFHLPKGMGETLGAIPLGLIMCLVALLTGSFLIPLLIHLALALSTHTFTILYNPDMHFRPSRA